MNIVLTILYLLIVLFILAMIIWIMFSSKKLMDKIIGAIAIIMLILRLLMIK